MLGKKLKELRKKNGYTLEALADKLYISRQTIAKWESDESSIDIDSLKKLSKIYDIAIEDLLTENQEDSNYLHPKNKFVFGISKIEDDGSVVLPEYCLNKFNLKSGDKLLILGDLEQGIALVRADNYEEFANQILKIKEENEKSNNNK